MSESKQKIPESWEMKKFGDVIESSLYGCNPETGEDIDGISYLRISDINSKGEIKNKPLPQNAKFENKEQAEKYILSEGDVVIARSGSIGQAYVYNNQDDEMVYASYLIKFSLDTEQVLTDYIDAYTMTPMYWKQVKNAGKGAVQTNINAGSIKEFEIPVPPLDEQERIVSVVEERLERVERLEKSVENIGRLADEYQDSYKSYLSSGIDVESSEVMKGIPGEDTLPDGWNLSPLSEVADINPRSSYDELDEYAYVPMDAVSADTQSVERFARRDSVYSSLARFEEGDILFARITPCFENGKIAVTPELPDGYEFAVGSSEFAVIRPNNIDTDYLHMYLTSPVVKEWGENRLVGSTNRERIQVTQIRNELSIPVPPMEKQKEIVDEVRKTDFSKVSKAVSDLDNHFNEYRSSVLAHAFTGEIEY